MKFIEIIGDHLEVFGRIAIDEVVKPDALPYVTAIVIRESPTPSTRCRSRAFDKSISRCGGRSNSKEDGQAANSQAGVR